MNFKEISEKFDELDISKSDFAFESDSSFKKNFGMVETVSYGYIDRDNWHIVRYFKDHHIYIRLDGYRSSYDDIYIHDEEIYEVFPKQVTKTEYLKTK